MSTVTDEQVISERLSLEMLERPHLWPGQRLGARCVMLKRYGPTQSGPTHTGPCFLTEELTPKPGPRYTVIDFDWTGERPLEPSVEQYDTAEEVLLAGWVVD